MPNYEVRLFEQNNHKIVKDFILSLSDRTIAKFYTRLDLLEKFGHLLRMPHVKKIDSQLYELRIRGEEEIRFIFIFKNHTIHIIHGFKKKRDRIDQKELKIARKRLTYI